MGVSGLGAGTAASNYEPIAFNEGVVGEGQELFGPQPGLAALLSLGISQHMLEHHVYLPLMVPTILDLWPDVAEFLSRQYIISHYLYSVIGK